MKKDICFQCEQEDIILEKEGVCSHCDYLNRRNDYENKVVEITKDNIHLYYEFMSDEELERYGDILSDKIIARINIVAGKLNFNIGAIGGKELELFNSFLDEKRNKNQSKYIGISIFGVKDTLKPIEEYIEEIKASDAYKEYISKKS